LDSWVFENYPAVENKEEAKNIEMGQSQQTRDEFDGREIRPIDALSEIKHPMQNWVRLSRGGWWSLRVAGDATRTGGGDAGKASEWMHRDTSKSKGPSPSLRDGLFNETIGQEIEQLAVIL
jgi:hypothetical protein